MKYLLVFTLIAVVFGLMPRQQAPSFSAIAVLPNHSFSTINLSDYAGKYVVLLFYPFDFTYVCPTEITSYSDKAAEFRSNTIVTKASAQRSLLSLLIHISHTWLGGKLPENKED